MPIMLDSESAREYLGVTKNAWSTFTSKGIVKPVPFTEMYFIEDLNKAPERAREVYEQEQRAAADNTIQLKELQSKPKEGKKPAQGHASCKWQDGAAGVLASRVAGEGE